MASTNTNTAATAATRKRDRDEPTSPEITNKRPKFELIDLTDLTDLTDCDDITVVDLTGCDTDHVSDDEYLQLAPEDQRAMIARAAAQNAMYKAIANAARVASLAAQAAAKSHAEAADHAANAVETPGYTADDFQGESKKKYKTAEPKLKQLYVRLRKALKAARYDCKRITGDVVIKEFIDSRCRVHVCTATIERYITVIEQGEQLPPVAQGFSSLYAHLVEEAQELQIEEDQQNGKINELSIEDMQKMALRAEQGRDGKGGFVAH